MRIFAFMAALLVGSLVGGTAAFATPTVWTGTVKELHARSDNLHYIFINGTSSGTRPACAGSNTYMMIKDETSNGGKSQIAMLMTAYASGRTITVVGAGTCVRWVDGEDISEIIYN